MKLKERLLKFWKEEDGFIGALFGSLAGKLGAGAIGKAVATGVGGIIDGRIGASEDRRNARKDYEQQRALGFTHSEIAGSGGAGAGDTMASVMGNQATQQEAQRRQMEYDNLQRDKDRAVALQGQATQLQSAQTAAAASMYSSDVQSRGQDLQYSINSQKLINEWAVNNPEMNLRLKQMSMGVDNVKMDFLIQKYGLTPQDMVGLNQRDVNKRMSGMLMEMSIMSGSPKQILGQAGAELNSPLNYLFGTLPSDNRLPSTVPVPSMPPNFMSGPAPSLGITPPG